jgi:hypothetical protein
MLKKIIYFIYHSWGLIYCANEDILIKIFLCLSIKKVMIRKVNDL